MSNLTTIVPEMNPIKRLLGHVFFIYALLLFVVTMLIVYIPIWLVALLPEPKRSIALHKVFRLWMGIYMPLVFCPVRRKGKEYFRAGEQYVVVSNHNSFVDVPVTSPWIPGPNKTLAKMEMGSIPIFGKIYRTGSILVDRQSESSRQKSFMKMRGTLRMGLHLCVFPEGTRNKSNKPLQHFRDGAFTVAIKEQKPIMPALIFNTGKILPHNKKFWAWPHVIDLHFLPPIPTEGYSSDNIADFKDKVRNVMMEYYVSNLKQ